MKVLIPDYYGQQMLAGIRALARSGYECGFAGSYAALLGYTARSRFVKKYHQMASAQLDETRYIKDIITLAKKYHYDAALVFSLSSSYLFSKYQDQLSAHLKIMVPSFSSFNKAHDKLSASLLCQSLDIPTPQLFSNYKNNDIAAIASHVRYPVIIKARKGCGVNLFLRLAHTKEELIKAYHEISNTQINHGSIDCTAPLIQEYIPGDIHDVCSLSIHGVQKVALTQIRNVMYPVSGGVGAYNTTTHNTEITDLTRRILEKLNWHGPAQIEFKYDTRDQRYKFIEINPKLWGTLDLSIRAGVNFPKMIADYLTLEKMPTQVNYASGLSYKFLFPKYTLSFLESKLAKSTSENKFSIIKSDFIDFDRSDCLPDCFRVLLTFKKVLEFITKKTISLTVKWILHLLKPIKYVKF